MIGTLKVTPEQLITSASTFSDTGSSVSTLTNQMVSLVESLSSVFRGEAATAYLSKFSQLNDDIQRLINMVIEHSDDLKEMASIFQQAESSNMEAIANLSGDVII